jgi:TonB family protein
MSKIQLDAGLTTRSSRPVRLSRGLQGVKNNGKPRANRPGGLAPSVRQQGVGMKLLSSVIGLLYLVGCSSTLPSSGRMDDGKPLPIVLTQYSAIDTTIVLRGAPPVDTVDTSTPVDLVNLDGPTPIPRVMISPQYPEPLRQKGIEGTVWMKLLVSSEGDVARAIIMKTDHDGFNQAALRAAIQWKYTPAHDGDSVISCWAALPMRFRLNK